MTINENKLVRLFPYNEDKTPYTVSLTRGRYRIEAWGASGGKTGDVRDAYGAYVSGTIKIGETKTFLIYVGGKGENAISGDIRAKGGFNGGGDGGLAYSSNYAGGSGGGGSTDIRTDQSKESRILVAAGGGGSAGSYKDGSVDFYGGHGGDEEGGIAGGYVNTTEERSQVPNQEKGYQLLQGQQGRDSDKDSIGCSEGNGGAGGGYYGGYSIQSTEENSRAGGSGGSSYINKEYFINPIMKNGGENFNSPYGTPEKAYLNGFLKITPILRNSCHCQKRIFFHFVFIFSISK